MNRFMKCLVSAVVIAFAAAAFAASSAKQFDFLMAGLQNASGKPLSGYIVVTRNSADSAPKAVWEDKDMTLPTGAGKSQFTLDSQGRAKVYGDGVYTIKLYAAADTLLTSPLYTFSGVSYDFTTTLVSDLANTGTGLGSSLVGLDGYPGETVTTHVNSTAAHGATGAVVGTTNTQVLTNKTLTSPAIGNFTNATHTHISAATGGELNYMATGYTPGDKFRCVKFYITEDSSPADSIRLTPFEAYNLAGADVQNVSKSTSNNYVALSSDGKILTIKAFYYNSTAIKFVTNFDFVYSFNTSAVTEDIPNTVHKWTYSTTSAPVLLTIYKDGTAQDITNVVKTHTFIYNTCGIGD